MKVGQIALIGSFPPPYGGATIKNEILYNELIKNYTVTKIDTSKMGFKTILQIILTYLSLRYTRMIISVSSFSLIKLTKVFCKLSYKNMNKVSVFIVGGRFPEFFEKYGLNKDIYSNYKVIYVECIGMKEKLDKLGLTNVEVIPNFRSEYKSIENLQIHKDNNNFKIIFLSRISENKGIWTIIEACKILNSNQTKYSLDFYGPIDKEIECKFINEVNTVENIEYKGVFDSINQDVYKKLNEYHVLVLPTYHKGEGVPGILVESKIAAIPSIVSNINYNKETINHMIDGIVLNENTPIELAKSIEFMISNNSVRNKLAENSKLDSERFLINKYINRIIECKKDSKII